jgi:ribonuclease P protein component
MPPAPRVNGQRTSSDLVEAWSRSCLRAPRTSSLVRGAVAARVGSRRRTTTDRPSAQLHDRVGPLSAGWAESAVGVAHRPRRPTREAYLPAQRPKACQASRIPSPHGRSGRPSGPQGSSPQGPNPVVGLIWSIRDRATFDSLRREGRRVRSGSLWVRYLPGPADEPAKVAYAIGRRVGGAVTRTRVRRRLRAVLADLDRDGRIPPGAYLIGAGDDLGALTHSQLLHRVDDLIAQLHDGRP